MCQTLVKRQWINKKGKVTRAFSSKKSSWSNSPQTCIKSKVEILKCETRECFFLCFRFG